nr:nucleotide-binding, alpha-beta plait [Tanacetum cinerariifolium]
MLIFQMHYDKDYRAYFDYGNHTEKDAQSAMNDLAGKWLDSRQIRCNWATKGAATSDEKHGSDSNTAV